MKILLGYTTCPHTRAAFEAHGHDVWSCDLRADPHPKHLQMDIWEAIGRGGWGFGLFHPMCTYLTVSAAWAYGDGPYHQKVKPETLVGAARRAAREEAIENFKALDALPFPHAIENPALNFVSKAHRAPDQKIQPYQFGEDASKNTGLWLFIAPPLTSTSYVAPRMVDGRPRWANQTDSGQNRVSPSADRWLERSKTYPGIAAAMGDQWGRI